MLSHLAAYLSSNLSYEKEIGRYNLGNLILYVLEYPYIESPTHKPIDWGLPRSPTGYQPIAQWSYRVS